MNKKVFLQAHSNPGFPFEFYIEKAVPQEEDGELIIEGVASTPNVDHDNERMSDEAIASMTRVVNETGVPLRWEHQKDDNAVLGKVYRAWVDDRKQMHIRASLNKNHPAATMLHDSLRRGIRYGLSVGGKITDASKEIVEGVGKYVNTFYDILLDEVSVTKRPSNYDSWLKEFAKSIKEDVGKYSEDYLYDKFIFGNPKYNYLAEIAKSVPEDSWKSVNSLSTNKTQEMKEDEKDKKDTEGKEEKSYLSKAEFSKFSDEMTKSIVGLTNLVKAMGETALDTTNPDSKKDKDDTQQTAKGEDAMDQNNPDKAKTKEETEQKAKTRKGDKDEDEKEKSADDEDEKKDKARKAWPDEGTDDKEKSADDEDEKEKAMDDEEDEKKKSSDVEEEMKEKKKAREGQEDEGGNGSDEHGEREKTTVKTLSQAIKAIQTLTKNMRGSKVQKSEKIEKSSSESEIDVFAAEIANYLDESSKRFEKSGITIPGYADNVMSRLRNDRALQSEVRKMIREPGAKKSVSMGNAYVVTKEGKRFQLSAVEDTSSELRKSAVEGKVNFKTLYKAEFSAFKDEEAQ